MSSSPPPPCPAEEITFENQSAPVIEVQNLFYAYPGGSFALQDVSLKIFKGEFVAILGANGAGKTTLIRHFNGLTLADAGHVLIEGTNTRDHSPSFFADRIGYLFQNPESQLFADTVREEVGFALRLKGLAKGEINIRVQTVLKELGLSETADCHPYTLGPGVRQLIALAACLVAKPSILVLDEPLSHLSFPRNWQTLELIARLNRQGLTIILITHDIGIARSFSTRNIFMDKGRVIHDIPSPCRHPGNHPGSQRQ